MDAISPRRILLTGGSSGIGAAAALAFAREGCALWLTYTSSVSRAERVALECRQAGAPEVHIAHLDLNSPESIDNLVVALSESWGSLEVLVNNGGSCPYTDFDAITLEEWDLVMATNVRGPFLLTRALIPLLRASEATDRCIVNVSSIAGQTGALQTGAHYSASKGALLALTRTLARRLAPEGIRANVVCPGPIDTNITQQLDAGAFTALGESVPLGRWGTAAEAAYVVTSLASSKASFITGATYDVNGGVRIA